MALPSVLIIDRIETARKTVLSIEYLVPSLAYEYWTSPTCLRLCPPPENSGPCLEASGSHSNLKRVQRLVKRSAAFKLQQQWVPPRFLHALVEEFATTGSRIPWLLLISPVGESRTRYTLLNGSENVTVWPSVAVMLLTRMPFGSTPLLSPGMWMNSTSSLFSP